LIEVYDSEFRGACPLEDTDLANFIAWFDYNYPHLSHLMIHVPNESDMPVQGRVKAKKKGVRSGVPDLLFLYPINGFVGLSIEMKRQDKTKCKVSKNQEMYAQELSAVGYFATFAYGLEESKKALKIYLHSKQK